MFNLKHQSEMWRAELQAPGSKQGAFGVLGFTSQALRSPFLSDLAHDFPVQFLLEMPP